VSNDLCEDTPLRLPIAIILMANLVPIFIGITGYLVLGLPLSADYITFTTIFWLIASFFLIWFNRRTSDSLMILLQEDLSRQGIIKFLTFLAVAIILLNLPWLSSARSSGIDNRDLVFKIFFLFEDLFFVVIALTMLSLFTRPSIRSAIIVAFLITFLSVVFGRFGIITIFCLLILLVSVDANCLGIRKKIILGLLFLLTLLGVLAIEIVRSDTGLTTDIYARLLDRIGEFATLSIVDSIFANETKIYFDGFENLQYLYAPSIFFPDKPIINDGSVFLRSEFGLGAGTVETRFPILLHIDAYRRFGWYGLWAALLPSAFVFLIFKTTIYFRKYFHVPFLALIAMKYAIFMYPKSILGLLEILFYTFIRSALVFIFLFFCLQAIGCKCQKNKITKSQVSVVRFTRRIYYFKCALSIGTLPSFLPPQRENVFAGTVSY
jgi:hypothetical protein